MAECNGFDPQVWRREENYVVILATTGVACCDNQTSKFYILIYVTGMRLELLTPAPVFLATQLSYILLLCVEYFYSNGQSVTAHHTQIPKRTFGG